MALSRKVKTLLKDSRPYVSSPEITQRSIPLLGLNLENSLFKRSWDYIHTDGSGKITLRQLGAGLSAITRDGPPQQSFVFSLVDTDQTSSLSFDEVLDFFTEFISVLSHLSVATLERETSFLLLEGTPHAEIAQRIEARQTLPSQ